MQNVNMNVAAYAKCMLCLSYKFRPCFLSRNQNMDTNNPVCGVVDGGVESMPDGYPTASGGTGRAVFVWYITSGNREQGK